MAISKCKHFGKCGGCSLQHVPYEVQLKNKQKLLQDLIKFDKIQVFYSDEFYYRNRMDFIFHNNGLGFREKGKCYSIVNIDRCFIADEQINRILDEIKQFFKQIDAFNVKKHHGTFRYAVIRTANNESSVSFVLNPESTKLNEAVNNIKKFAEETKISNVIITYVQPRSDVSISEDYFVVKGKDYLTQTIMGKEFRFSVQGFFQNNIRVTELLHEYVKQLIKENNGELLDLYGGVGTFGIINSDNFEKVTIVEEFEGSIKAAKENIKINNAKNVSAIVMDAKKLNTLKFEKQLVVITDPPRSGMHPKTIKALNEIRPKKIIYVSCNAKQLAKELKQFVGYHIKSVALFDMFPQTQHFETVVELVTE
jgi:23S rRNA (uracil-5-)-methyltransferase RumA